MAEAFPSSKYRFGFRSSFGSLRGHPRKSKHFVADPKAWYPKTKLGRLVKAGKISSLEDIYSYALPMKEHEIIDHFIGPSLRQMMLKIVPSPEIVAASTTCYSTVIVIGDCNGHLGFGMKSAEGVGASVSGAIVCAKNNMVPVRLGFWGRNVGEPHTVPCNLNGKCGDVEVRLAPAPRGTGIMSAAVPRILIQLAGITDCYTGVVGCTKSIETLAMATFKAIAKTNAYLALDRWTNMSTQGDKDFSSYLKDSCRSLMTPRGRVQNNVK